MITGPLGEAGNSLENGAEAGQASANAAWATAQIPLPAQELLAFLADIERLFRLNPHLEISDWLAQPDSRSYRMHALNETNDVRGEIGWRVEAVRENTLWGKTRLQAGV